MLKRKVFAALIFAVVLVSQVYGFECSEVWHNQLGRALTSGIAQSGNAVFLGDVSGNFYALNKNNGSVLWTYQGTNTNSIIGTPSVVRDRVIFAQGDGTITCLKTSDGSVLWQNVPYENVSGVLTDGTSAGGGMVFVAQVDSMLYALDDKNGHTLWKYKGGDQGIRNVPAYGEGLVLLGEYDGIFSMIDGKTGKRVNGGGAGGAVNTPEVNKGNVYFSAWDGSVNAVKIKGVIPLWNSNVKDPVNTAPAVGSGVVAVGTARGHVVALNESDGSILWNYDTKAGSISAKPVVADGVVIAGAPDGVIYVFDAKSGNIRRTLNTEYGISTNPAYSDGVLYFVSGGTVYAIR